MGVYRFTTKVQRIFDLIVKPIIETHTGLTYVDARSHYESLSIKMDLISRLIADAKLVIVDVSHENPNVFLELGMAYAYKKSLIFLCSESSYKKAWKTKMPFDTEGKELLIFKDEKDLKVKLGKSVSDCLFKTATTTMSWISTNAKNHVKSACELEFFEDGKFWSSISVHNNFILSYHVTIHDFDDKRNPDLRLFFSPISNGFPRIGIIFPWEHFEIDKEKYECHIDFFRVEELVEDASRLQQVPVSKKQKSAPFEFDVFVSFYYPNLVFESSLFDNDIDRLVVPISQFQYLQFPTHFNQYIGFGSAHRVSITGISIKEVFI